MSLQWTIVATVLYAEIGLVLLFSISAISVKTWARFFKSRFLQVLSKQAFWYFNVILFLLALLLLDAIREMRKYNTTEVYPHGGHLEDELQKSMRLFRAQRNFYISGFSLFLTFVIRRFANLIIRLAQVEAENEAVLKQAQSATQTARNLMSKAASGEEAQNSSNEAHQLEVNKLTEEIEELKKKAELLEKDKEAVITQSKALEKEYDRLTEEHRKLQAKITAEGESKKDD